MQHCGYEGVGGMSFCTLGCLVSEISRIHIQRTLTDSLEETVYELISHFSLGDLSSTPVPGGHKQHLILVEKIYKN